MLLTSKLHQKLVVAHIRRGDVTMGFRWISDSAYLEIFEKLLKRFGGEIRICIVSEGRHENFADILNMVPPSKLIMLLNHDLKETFHTMVHADILVPARSSLSYCAAVLCKGVVCKDIVEGYQAESLKHWLTLDEACLDGRKSHERC